MPTSTFTRGDGKSKVPRGLAYLVLALVALIFTIAAFSTRIFHAEASAGGQNSEAWASIWYACQRVWTGGNKPIYQCYDPADPEITCQATKDSVRAARAFAVLTMIFVVVTVIAGVADHFAAAFFADGKEHIILGILAVVVALTSTVTWAIGVAYPHTEFCDRTAIKDTPGFEWGAAPFLMLIVTVVAILQAAAAFVLPRRAIVVRHEAVATS